MLRDNPLQTMEIDTQTSEVRADGVLLTCEPARSGPLLAPNALPCPGASIDGAFQLR